MEVFLMLCNRIGSNIKSLRQEIGMTQSQLADRLYVSHQMISRYENDSTLPDITTLIKLCEVFQVSLDCLCGLEDSSKAALIKQLTEAYSSKNDSSFSVLQKEYESFLKDAETVLLDDRVLRIQLSLLENMHNNIENDRQHRVVNELIFECASRVLDLSRDDELRSYANYLMAIYYWETPFDSPDHAKNQVLSKSYAKKVLLSTYFPEYTPPMGEDIRSEEYLNTQINNAEFFEKKLYGIKKRLKSIHEKTD